jgi:hypothetical protein
VLLKYLVSGGTHAVAMNTSGPFNRPAFTALDMALISAVNRPGSLHPSVHGGNV